jgi:NADPH2:quinone reductase
MVKAWRVLRYGPPSEVMELQDAETPSAGAGEVRIRVSSLALNFNEIDSMYGRYKSMPLVPPYTPGMEVLGTVDECGAGAEEWLGKRVVAIPNGAQGGYSEAVIASTIMTFEMPDDIPEPGAAAILMPFHVAWLGVHDRGRIQPGETLLVHAAAGGVGSAALQLGVAAGARVIATAGSQEKLEFCRTLGAEVAINYRDTDFLGAVLEATDGLGVDVAFDGIGGATTVETFKCMAYNGRHLMFGFSSDVEAQDEGIVPRPINYGNFGLFGVCLAYVEDPKAIKRMTNGYNFVPRSVGDKIHARLLDLVRRGEVRPVVGLEAPFADIPAALEKLAARQTIGRVVVRLDP